MEHNPRVRVKYSPKRIVVTSKSEIRYLVSNYMPSSDTQGRKLLIEGLNQIKDRIYLENQYANIDHEAFGDFKPIIPVKAATHWVDRMIENAFNAKRDGLLIVWTLKDGKHSFDPFTGEIKYDIN